MSTRSLRGAAARCARLRQRRLDALRARLELEPFSSLSCCAGGFTLRGSSEPSVFRSSCQRAGLASEEAVAQGRLQLLRPVAPPRPGGGRGCRRKELVAERARPGRPSIGPVSPIRPWRTWRARGRAVADFASPPWPTARARRSRPRSRAAISASDLRSRSTPACFSPDDELAVGDFVQRARRR